jgi:hypothetical protein
MGKIQGRVPCAPDKLRCQEHGVPDLLLSGKGYGKFKNQKAELRSKIQNRLFTFGFLILNFSFCILNWRNYGRRSNFQMFEMRA